MKKPVVFSIHVILILCGAILLCSVLVLSEKRLRVADIAISGTSDLRGLEIYKGKYIFLLQAEDIEAELLKRNPMIAEVNVRKVYPSGLSITVTSHTHTSMLELSDGYALLSETGKVVAKYNGDIDRHDIPIIRYYQPLYRTDVVTGGIIEADEVHAATVMLFALHDTAIDIGSIDIANENMIVLKADGFDVIMTAEQDINAQLDRLKYVYKELSINGKDYSSIDVRFDKPIIKTL